MRGIAHTGDKAAERGLPAASISPIQLGEPLASWVLDPDLDKHPRMDPRVIVGVALDTIAGGIPDDIRADCLACYDGDRFAESMHYVRRYPEELPVLAGLLPQVTVPVTIINGRHDRVVPSPTRNSSTCGCPPAAS